MDKEHFTTNDKGQRIATYCLAGINVEIKSVYKRIHLMCSDYLTDAPHDIVIETTPEEIEQQRDSFNKEDALERGDDRLNYIETLLIYRKLALILLDYHVLLIHGSCIAANNAGVLFTALSGTGKSTHTRLWRKMLGDKAVMVNDDKPLVAIKKSQSPIIYGTPWDGKHHLSTNTCVPLKAIVHLERGEQNEIHEIDAKEMFPVLIQQTFRTEDPIVTIKVLDLLGELTKNVKFYDLHCNMNPEAAIVSYNAIFNV